MDFRIDRKGLPFVPDLCYQNLKQIASWALPGLQTNLFYPKTRSHCSAIHLSLPGGRALSAKIRMRKESVPLPEDETWSMFVDHPRFGHQQSPPLLPSLFRRYHSWFQPDHWSVYHQTSSPRFPYRSCKSFCLYTVSYVEICLSDRQIHH